MAVSLAAVILGGCQVGSRPRLRISDFFGNPWGMRFADPNDLGRHCLDACRDEKLGLVYTCRAGFIDIGHLREAADRTQYLTQITYKNLMQSTTSYSYRVVEPSRYSITLGYPNHWKDLSRPEREATAREISIQLGQYLAHTSLIWHEILTWYGFSSGGLFPENISAFSLEDPYSDVLGTHLEVKVLSDPRCFYEETAYEEAMATLIKETLKELDAQPPETTERAAERIKGDWYEGGYYFFVEMKKRNLDVGLDDRAVTPWRVPGICPETAPQDSPAPGFGFLDEYGFKIKVRLKSVEFQKGKIYAAAGLKRSDRITPYIHFPIIIESIRKEAKQLEGNNVDTPENDKTLAMGN
jgi:hypothetical protein